MTRSDLERAWDEIKNRRAGPYSTWTPEQHAGAILAIPRQGFERTLSSAISYTEQFIEDWNGPGSYWVQVRDCLISARDNETINSTIERK